MTQRAPDGSWKSIWEISGKTVRRSLEYGVSYEGMTTQVPAQPLVRDGIYRVEVQAGMLFWQAAPGDGRTSFIFDAATGKAVDVHVQRDGTVLRQ